jgi:low temperature requirement protein LtrA
MLRILTKGLTPRRRDEMHRTATPLELMFDLAAVIAVAASASGLHHAISNGHVIDGVFGFLVGFWMIWLAWLNYTWFASAYDDGSVGFQILSMVIMFGALMLAAGIPAVFAHERIWIAVCGFVIMRLSMALFWLLAARGDPDHRRTAIFYALGIVTVQTYWIVFIILVPPTAFLYLPCFLFGAICELAVPALAERHGTTSWHRHHIIERYGLMTIIVLGECFLAIVLMIGQHGAGLVLDQATLTLAFVSALITFSLWALYFGDDRHLIRDELRHALLWGYAHLVLFAAAAAVGAGFAVNLDALVQKSPVSPHTAALAIAIPVAVYQATLWLARDRLVLSGAKRWLLLVSALLVLCVGAFLPQPMPLIAALLILTITLRHARFSKVRGFEPPAPASRKRGQEKH